MPCCRKNTQQPRVAPVQQATINAALDAIPMVVEVVTGPAVQEIQTVPVPAQELSLVPAISFATVVVNSSDANSETPSDSRNKYKRIHYHKNRSDSGSDGMDKSETICSLRVPLSELGTESYKVNWETSSVLETLSSNTTINARNPLPANSGRHSTQTATTHHDAPSVATHLYSSSISTSSNSCHSKNQQKLYNTRPEGVPAISDLPAHTWRKKDKKINDFLKQSFPLPSVPYSR